MHDNHIPRLFIEIQGENATYMKIFRNQQQ